MRPNLVASLLVVALIAGVAFSVHSKPYSKDTLGDVAGDHTFAVQVDQPAAARTYYVATTGSDSNPGTIGSPFLTIDYARAVVKAEKLATPLNAPGSIVVYIRGGTYYVSSQITFGAADSGTADNPIIYRAYPGERVVVTGAKQMTNVTTVSDGAILSRLTPEAQTHVVTFDLTENSVTAGDPLTGRAPYTSAPTWPLVVSQQNASLHLARWPKAGTWETVASVSDPVNGVWTYASTRPSSWASTTDIQIHSFPYYDWADYRDTIASLDTGTKTITVVGNPLSVYGYRAADLNQTYGIYYYENVLEELTEAGEYYIDRANSKVYVWPPSADLTANPLYSAVSDRIIYDSGASYLRFIDLEITGARGDTAVTVKNAHDVYLHDLNIHDVAGVGAEISGNASTHDDIISSSTFTNTGSIGALVSCGDKSQVGSLTAGNCQVINSNFTRSAQSYYGAQGTLVDGVSDRVAFSNFSDMPHSGAQWLGNNQLLEYNDVRDVDKLSNDAGAFYTGRQLVQRGGTIRYNRFENVTGHHDLGACGVYLDDGQQGYTITGNLFKNVEKPFCLSGSDLTISNNVVVEPGDEAMRIDNRNYTWMAYAYPSAIASVSGSAPYTITTTRPNGLDSWAFTAGTVTLEGISGMPGLNGTWNVSNVTPTTFQIDAPPTGGTSSGEGLAIPSMTYLNDVRNTKTNPAFTGQYPELYARAEDELYQLTNLAVNKNVFYLGGNIHPWDYGISTEAQAGATIASNYVAGSGDFVDLAGDNLALVPTSGAFATGFTQLPLSIIGQRALNTFIDAIPDQTLEPGQNLSIHLTNSFMDDHSMTPSYIVRGLPEGASYDASSKTITWTPQAGDVGGTGTVTVESIGTVFAQRTFQLSVIAPPASPTPTPSSSSTSVAKKKSGKGGTTSTSTASPTASAASSTATPTSSRSATPSPAPAPTFIAAPGSINTPAPARGTEALGYTMVMLGLLSGAGTMYLMRRSG